MSAIERLQYEAVIEERDKARRECERLTRQLEECRSEVSFVQNLLGDARQQLAAAEVLNAEAAAAGPIVDAEISDLRVQVLERTAELRHAHARIVELKTERPAETELERRAWELFASAMAAERDISPQQSFQFAANWMAHRDEFRRDGAT